MFKNISAVILAGGASSRFNNAVKTKIVIAGESIISRITSVLNDVFEEIIIVTNTPDEFEEYYNCKIVTDQFKNAGPLGGIHAAFKASSKEALFVCAGDMPLLDKRFIIRQAGYYNNNKCDILVPRINSLSEPLHAIYNLSLIKTLEEYLSGDKVFAVIEFFKAANVSYLQLDDTETNRNMFANINSPADIAPIEKILANGY
jgi:molybdopterin-guanine dinucleotide biosynthesis protein A